MTLRVWVTESNYSWLVTKAAEAGEEVAAFIRDCIDMLYSANRSDQRIPEMVNELPLERPRQITVGLDRMRWSRLQMLCIDLRLNKTKVVYTAVRSYHQAVIDQEKEYRATDMDKLDVPEPL